jgi:hypothetical protein
MNRNVLIWEIGGFFFIGILGASLHFTYELSDFSSNLVAYFSAVNESTWEHLKMVFFPGLLFALIEYTYIRKEVNNFIFAKTISLIVMPLTIFVGWYIYAPLAGRSIFPADLALFYVAVYLGQFASYKLLIRPTLRPEYRRVAFGAFAVLLVAFSLFTFFPPKIFLFEHLDLLDTGQFGILPYEDNIRYFSTPASK